MKTIKRSYLSPLTEPFVVQAGGKLLVAASLDAGRSGYDYYDLDDEEEED